MVSWHIGLLCIGLHSEMSGALKCNRPTWEYIYLGLGLNDLRAEEKPDTGSPGVYFPPNKSL